MRTSAPLPPASLVMFSTLMTRSAVYSSVSFSSPLVICDELPMVPSTSNDLAPPAMGSAFSFTREPPSSKLLW